MASTDALPVAIKNTAFRVTFPILDADGDPVTGATGLDSEVSKDAGTFADCTNEATEIATSSGVYYLDLTSTEMNADTVAVIVKTSSSGAKTTVLIFYPQETGDIKVDVQSISGDATAADNLETAYDDTAGSVPWTGIIDQGTAQAATSTTIRLRSAAAFADDEIIGATVWIISATTGAGQSRTITDYVSSTDTATVDAWTTTPTGTIVYKVAPTPPSNIATAATNIANIATAFELDGSVYRLTANAVEQVSGFDPYLFIGTATSGTTTSLICTALIGGNDDRLKDHWVAITSGTTDTETRLITGSVAATGAITFTPALTAAVTTNGVKVYRGTVSRLAPISHPSSLIAGIAGTKQTLDALDTAQNTQHLNSQVQLTNVQSRIPASLSSGRMRSDVEAVIDIDLQADGSGTQDIGGP